MIAVEVEFYASDKIGWSASVREVLAQLEERLKKVRGDLKLKIRVLNGVSNSRYLPWKCSADFIIEVSSPGHYNAILDVHWDPLQYGTSLDIHTFRPSADSSERGFQIALRHLLNRYFTVVVKDDALSRALRSWR